MSNIFHHLDLLFQFVFLSFFFSPPPKEESCYVWNVAIAMNSRKQKKIHCATEYISSRCCTRFCAHLDSSFASYSSLVSLFLLFQLFFSFPLFLTIHKISWILKDCTASIVIKISVHWSWFKWNFMVDFSGRYSREWTLRKCICALT